MQVNTQTQSVLRTWRLRPESRLRDRLLDIVGHLLIMAILVLFLSLVQTVITVPTDTSVAGHGLRFYPNTQETRHASGER